MHSDMPNITTTTSQVEVIAFLSDPHKHSQANTIQRIDTHAAMVFLIGPLACKIKRAVAYPFLDFSTLEKRRLACAHEIKVNQANAPQIYIGAVAITRQRDNQLEIDGSGEVVEWAVLMNRFDENLTLDKVVENGPISDELANRLACEMVRIQAQAPLRPATPWIADLARYINDNSKAFARHADIFPTAQAAGLEKASLIACQQIKPLLERRGSAGHVRLCHGDAHLGNIVLIDGQPVFFDAIEFSDVIATADVLYDLAFLLMDLWHRGHAHESNVVFNRYLSECRAKDPQAKSPQAKDPDASDHYQGLAALPFFLMMRAAIRAKVTIARREFCPKDQHTDISAQAQAYFVTACDFLNDTPPRLVAVGGLSGSGKSTVAAHIAASIGRAPGAVVLRSDVMRKQLFGLCETQSLPQEGYCEATSQIVYEQLYETAAEILATGHSVIVDAVFARETERDMIAQIAQSADVAFQGVWLEAPQEVLIERVSTRQNDASDADETVVRKQTSFDLGAIVWARINAASQPDDVVAKVKSILE